MPQPTSPKFVSFRQQIMPAWLFINSNEKVMSYKDDYSPNYCVRLPNYTRTWLIKLQVGLFSRFRGPWDFNLDIKFRIEKPIFRIQKPHYSLTPGVYRALTLGSFVWLLAHRFSCLWSTNRPIIVLPVLRLHMQCLPELANSQFFFVCQCFLFAKCFNIVLATQPHVSTTTTSLTTTGHTTCMFTVQW